MTKQLILSITVMFASWTPLTVFALTTQDLIEAGYNEGDYEGDFENDEKCSRSFSIQYVDARSEDSNVSFSLVTDTGKRREQRYDSEFWIGINSSKPLTISTGGGASRIISAKYDLSSKILTRSELFTYPDGSLITMMGSWTQLSLMPKIDGDGHILVLKRVNNKSTVADWSAINGCKYDVPTTCNPEIKHEKFHAWDNAKTIYPFLYVGDSFNSQSSLTDPMTVHGPNIISTSRGIKLLGENPYNMSTSNQFSIPLNRYTQYRNLGKATLEIYNKEGYANDPEESKAKNSYCTGFLVSKNQGSASKNIILTARHCVYGEIPFMYTSNLDQSKCENFAVRQEYNGRPVYSFCNKILFCGGGFKQDYCFVEMQNYNYDDNTPVSFPLVQVGGQTFALKTSGVPNKNDLLTLGTRKLNTIGNTKGYALMASRGEGINSFDDYHFYFNAPSFPGNSGGPIFEDDGAVVGVLVQGETVTIGGVPVSTTQACGLDMAKIIQEITAANVPWLGDLNIVP